jgi:predicted TIM-barrel fold metal-dependent hydrolase
MSSPRRVIDAHLHLDESVPGPAAEAVRVLRAQLADAGVERAVVLHLETQRWPRREVADALRPHSELLGFANVHPLGPAPLEGLTQAVKEEGFGGLKLHPRLQRHSVIDDRVIALVRHAGGLGVPVLIDAFPDGDWLIEGHRPVHYAQLARACPDTRLIVAHMGGHHVIDMMMLAKRTPNMLLDTSFSLLYYRGSSVPADLVYAMRSMRFDRILYGSDYPDRSVPDTLEASIELLREHGLTDDQLDRILYSNARRVLRWADDG